MVKLYSQVLPRVLLETYDFMPRQENAISGYVTMYSVVMFDLPVKEKEERKIACQFRKFLLDVGYHMHQKSVYFRLCSNSVEAERRAKVIEEALPPGGTVSIMQLTSRQFEQTKVFISGKLASEDYDDKDVLTIF